MPSIEQFPQLSQAYMDNSRWLLQHLSEVTRDHPNQWVAVCDGRVVAADADLGVVSANAGQMAQTGDVVFQFVDDGSLIFSSNLLIAGH